MCIIRKIDARMSEELSNKQKCIVSESLRNIYRSATNEILGLTWIMHFLRKIEDGVDMSIYSLNEDLKSVLLSNISKTSREEKLTIRRKISCLKKNNNQENNVLLHFIKQNV